MKTQSFSCIRRQRWFAPVLAALLILPLSNQAQEIVYVQLPPSPSSGLVQDTNGNWSDPFASYDSQGLRLWGNDQNPAIYKLVINGQVAYTFTSNDHGFELEPAGDNLVVGAYLDSLGSPGAYPLTNGAYIGSDLNSSSYTWLGLDPAYQGLTLATARSSGTLGTPTLFSGPFAGIASGYIGLQFHNDGQTYYGWVRIGAPATINGGWIYNYAYQTTPNTPILAGQVTCAPVRATVHGTSKYIQLAWQSLIGNMYQVQYKEQLDATNWSAIGLVITAGATNTTVSVPMSASVCFYRIVESGLPE